ncbi:MAG: PLP-dependent transferase [Pseudomonadota bacterium]
MSKSADHFATICAQALHYIDRSTGGVTPPIQPSTTYSRDANYDLIGGIAYSRDENPIYPVVEKVLCALEGGGDALLFGSGIAAIAAAFSPLSVGEHIVVQRRMYFAAREFVEVYAPRRGWRVSWFEAGDLEGLKAAIIPGETVAVWAECPANPTWEILDIVAAAELAHAAGAQLYIDATAAPGIIQPTLELGADVVMHSATKYLNGHSDVIAGALICHPERVEDERWQAMKHDRHASGAVLGPFEAWLLLRGMRTLDVRLERAAANAAKIANHLAEHPAVEGVHYPGHPSHPQYDVAKRQMRGNYGGMLSFRVTGGAPEALNVIKACKRIISSTSIGGVESLIEHRPTIEGPASRLPENLIRLSVGIEHVDDLINDLDQALATIG